MIMTLDGGATLAASTTVLFTWARGLGERLNNVNGGNVNNPFPDILMTEGYDLITSTTGIGANTDYVAPLLRVEEWLVL